MIYNTTNKDSPSAKYKYLLVQIHYWFPIRQVLITKKKTFLYRKILKNKMSIMSVIKHSWLKMMRNNEKQRMKSFLNEAKGKKNY